MGEKKLEQLINPSWIKPSMTILQAANQAHLRGYKLQPSYNSLYGLRVVAVPCNDNGIPR